MPDDTDPEAFGEEGDTGPEASGREDDTGPEASGREDDTHRRMERALVRIRREGWKAAFIYAVVDAVALFLAANLLLTVVDPSWLPSAVPVPSAVAGVLQGAADTTGRATIPGSAVVAGGVGLFVLAVEVWFRVRQPLIERFEAGNPQVAEALRTARDAVGGDDDSRMATRLYGDVLGRLRETSSLALVDLRRVGVTVVLVVVLSTVTLQAAVYDVTLSGGSDQEPESSTDDQSVNFTGLQDGDAVLGEPEEVTTGDENLTARVESTGGDRQSDELDQFPSTDGPGGDESAGGVDSQQAGFAQSEQLEDAELIREYNIRIREETEEN